ncbi:CynX/NimT family MFS transporter [Tistrella mobilis]|uniref:CynX/NimT family MFS transporter n=1 Tax=Tistrella mobilis TaxID=171437 RepID=UPI0031F65059
MSTSSPRSSAAVSRGAVLLLIVAIVLVALNLRPALTSIGPLLGTVSAALGLDSATASLVTTLPVMCLGLFGPAAPMLARRIGVPAAAVVALVMIAVGVVLRGFFGPTGLFAGSLLGGAGIGIAGVLLPGVVKQAFPDKAGLLTGIYTMALCGGAAIAAGVTAPIAEASGSWAVALGVWAIPALLAAAVWWPAARHLDTRAGHRPNTGTRLLTSPLAWSITLFMGLQSSLAYSVFGWLPSILQDRGVSVVMSGLVVSVSLLVQTVSALFVPVLAARRRNQQLWVLGIMLCTIAGMLGMMWGPIATMWPWAVVLGIGQGGCFALALVMIVLRSGDAMTAARLSGMAQSVGYTLAALGPLAIGLIHEITGGWSLVAWLLTGIGLVALTNGLIAARDRTL